MMSVVRGLLAYAQGKAISGEERFGFGDACGGAAVERLLDQAVQFVGGGECGHGGLTVRCGRRCDGPRPARCTSACRRDSGRCRPTPMAPAAARNRVG